MKRKASAETSSSTGTAAVISAAVAAQVKKHAAEIKELRAQLTQEQAELRKAHRNVAKVRAAAANAWDVLKAERDALDVEVASLRVTNNSLLAQLQQGQQRVRLMDDAQARLQLNDATAESISRKLKVARQQAYQRMQSFQTDNIGCVADYLSLVIPDSGNVLDERGQSMHR